MDGLDPELDDPEPALPVGALNVVGPPTTTTDVTALCEPLGRVVNPVMVDEALMTVDVVNLGDSVVLAL